MKWAFDLGHAFQRNQSYGGGGGGAGLFSVGEGEEPG